MLPFRDWKLVEEYNILDKVNIALFDTFRLFNQTLNWAQKWFNSIFDSKKNLKYPSNKKFMKKISLKYSIQNFIQEIGEKKLFRNANLISMWFSNLRWEPVVMSGIAKWWRGEKFVWINFLQTTPFPCSFSFLQTYFLGLFSLGSGLSFYPIFNFDSFISTI